MKSLSLGQSWSSRRFTSALRTLTPESQKHPDLELNDVLNWAKAHLVQQDGPPRTDIFDPVRDELKQAIATTTGTERSFLKGLLSDYGRVKNSPAHGVGQDLLLYCTIRNASVDSAIRSSYVFLNVEEWATFCELVSNLSESLHSNNSGALRLLAVSCEQSASRHKGFFTSRHKMIATLRGRLRSLPFTPNNVIWFLVERSTKTKWFRLNPSTKPSIKDERRRLLHPPSVDKNLEIMVQSDASLLNVESSMITAGNLDPSKLADNHITLKWQSKAPRFTTDLDIYIWEPHKSLPAVCHADIRLSLNADTPEEILLIAFSHSASLRKFRNVCTRATVYQPDPPQGVQAWSLNSEVVILICDVFQVMVLELTNFIQECSVQLEEMAIAIRQNPSADKVRYLVHFEDCRTSAHEGNLHGRQVLRCLSRWLDHQQRSQQLWNAGLPFENRFACIQQDLEYFDTQLSLISTEVKDLQAKLRDHLELTHTRRNFLLTLLAAIFLPLSFATSFFGMNIQPAVVASNNGTKSIDNSTIGFSNYTAALIDTLPVDYQNSTRAIVSSIDSSGTATFTWETFIITAVLLVLTLPISLTIGGIFRLVYRTTTYYRTYWRIIAIVPSVAFVLLSVVPMEVAQHINYYDSNAWASDIPPVAAMVITSNVCNGLLIGFEFWKTYQAWRTRGRLAYWSTMSVITSVFFTITVVLYVEVPLLNNDYEARLEDTDDSSAWITSAILVPWMVIPWLCFAGTWFWSWWVRRRQE